ncbi:ornithine--oxo-acid transaminase [Candidatus Paracaedibacter symbiosus]|uniref:ornithine--oxo-acid transaminase n=1 Tax=Candidatus Paracaedibacter symbiosus TaxID=244582 RepID=UPI0005095E87|nr:ornithine--oxo-acid transaminase [Candidatus Paracaedibacter symbiosus]
MNQSKTAPFSALTAAEVVGLEHRWSARNYSPLPVVLNRGEGVWLWDVDGKKYMDMMSAYSAVSFGHCNPRILATLVDQASKLALCSRAYHNDVLSHFLEKLCKITGLDLAIPMNTGAEAVETAIKAVRRWGYMIKKIPENQAEIIVCSHNFHGRTVGIISFSSEPDYKKGFGPFLPGFKHVPFGDAKALEQAITPHTCAVITEPIQGEAGIVVPPKGWLKDVEKICHKNNVLLVVDEIQSGLGRTGKILACEHENVKPDGVLLGKALGGGCFPVSALVGSEELMSVFTPGSHGSTFAGNPLGSAIGLRSLELLEEERLCERSIELGNYLMKQLQQIESPIVKKIRGMGLWIGMEIHHDKASARWVCEEMAKLGVLSKETHETVVRFAPPLIVTKDELDWSLQRIRQVLEMRTLK